MTTVEPSDERFGQVSFRSRGLGFAVRVDEQDPGFLYIVLSLQLPTRVSDEVMALRATALTASRAKVIKAELDWEGRSVLLAAEQFVTEPGGPAVFWRLVSALEHSFYRLRQTFDEEVGRAAASRFTESLEAELTAREPSRLTPPPTTETR